MREVWLRSNPRALTLLVPLPLLLLVAGLVMLGVAAYLQDSVVCWSLGTLGAASGGAGLFAAWQWTRRPRLARESDHLLVYLGDWTPEAIPLEVVESFFRGNGASKLPAEDPAVVKTSTIVARLAEARTDWHSRPTREAFGEWKDGYIVFRGTWCEPITIELLRELNKRLGAAQREHRARTAQHAEAP